MNTTMITDEVEESNHTKPGSQLAEVRKLKGYSKDYVAGKLHLRVRVIELLEADDYHNMPEPVFIKGYLRAYARLLDMESEPLLKSFKAIYKFDKKIEKAPLWQQSRRESNRAESAVKLMTILFVVGAIMAVAFWWHKNKDTERLFSTNSQTSTSANKSESEIRLTDLSKMRSLLSSQNQFSTLEQSSE